tara:strand:+ start:222 stop:482 length:261 start_codon:yes stop_codon:yes gene_type:complete
LEAVAAAAAAAKLAAFSDLTKCGKPWRRTLDISHVTTGEASGLSSVTNQSGARSAYINSARHERDRNGASGMGDIAINASAAFVLH